LSIQTHECSPLKKSARLDLWAVIFGIDHPRESMKMPTLRSQRRIQIACSISFSRTSSLSIVILHLAHCVITPGIYSRMLKGSRS
jgi:hypothetical protein